jgi:hypothetical protein
MTSPTHRVSGRSMPAERQWSSRLLVLASVIVVGLGLYFILVRPPLLPEDERYIGAPTSAFESAGPRLTAWLGHVFRVMGDFILAAGALMSYVSATSFREGRRGAFLIVLLAGAVSIGWMVGVNFAIASDFRWLLLGLALPWAVAVTLWAVGR